MSKRFAKTDFGGTLTSKRFSLLRAFWEQTVKSAPNFCAVDESPPSAQSMFTDSTGKYSHLFRLRRERSLVALVAAGGVVGLLTVIWLTWFCCSRVFVYRDMASREVKIRNSSLQIVHSHEGVNSALSLIASGGGPEWKDEFFRSHGLLNKAVKDLASLEINRLDQQRDLEMLLNEYTSIARMMISAASIDGPDAALKTWLSPNVEQKRARLKSLLVELTVQADMSLETLDDEKDVVTRSITRASIGSTVILSILLLVGVFRIRSHVFRQARIEDTLTAQADQLTGQADQLFQLREEAESANKAKSDYLASTSHELRTPLTTIRGYADLLSDQLNRNEDLELVAVIRSRVDKLLQLINDLLDMSRIESGRLTIELQDVSPWTAACDVVESLRMSAESKGLTLTVTADQLIPKTILTDRLRYEQILINLTNNAVKYTERGRVVLRLSYDVDQHVLTTAVEDSGPGISKEALARIFERFNRGDANEDQEGAGLGLAISRQLAELLGGSLSVESSLGVGSAFLFSLPVSEFSEPELVRPESRQPGERPPKPTASEISERDLTGLNVLVVEDEPVNRLMITRMLEKQGAIVDSRSNGAAAIDVVRQTQHAGTPFDVILMDMRLPVVDGQEAVRRIRGEGFSGGIIALTANARAEDRNLSLEAGCDRFVAKPFDREQLSLTICEVSRR